MVSTDCRLVRTEAVALSSGATTPDWGLGDFATGVNFEKLGVGRGGAKVSEKLRRDDRSSPTRETT